MQTGRVLFPALRWTAQGGFRGEAARIDAALELGVGGFIIFGGPAEEVRGLTAELRRRAGRPLLIGADLERGAGQQFSGATSLPPTAAFGALDELDSTRRAGELTAREARALGVNWVYAPVADLDVEPRNPIVGSRAFGADPERVSAHVAAWIEGCRGGGALACAKHFPGHGRTTADSHIELPAVAESRDTLEADLAPFRAAAAAAVDAMMTAHVAYPALDRTGSPATLSAPIVTGLLRGGLGFDGLVVTDALIMEGVLAGHGEGEAAVAALRAGCDALLYPGDAPGVAAAAGRALETGGLEPEQVRRSIQRIEAAAERAERGETAAEWGRQADRDWAVDVALRSLRVVRGEPRLSDALDLITLDDDVGGPFPPGPRDALAAALRRRGVEVQEPGTASPDRPVLVALYADIRGWKGRPGVSEKARHRLAEVVEGRQDAVLAFFGHPRLAADLPGAHVLAAWGGEPLMQEAAALRLTDASTR